MAYIKHVWNKRKQKIERVLSFGKYKGFTIKEIYSEERNHNNSGYLRWCLHKVKGFKEELTSEEYDIAQKDYSIPRCVYTNDHEGPGAWLDASDGSLYCGFACEADMF